MCKTQQDVSSVDGAHGRTAKFVGYGSKVCSKVLDWLRDGKQPNSWDGHVPKIMALPTYLVV